MIKEKKVFKTLTEEKIKKIEEVLYGLDSSEWAYIKGSVDMYFTGKAAKIKIDDLKEFDMLMQRGY